ncbi:hypothetical protein [Agromyces sp. NPDC057865]|uniref:hypothetical protein n=1 Tax=Agromyces sp. NPDC057865 TaxID=3346267 RepID=UPI00366DED97
MEQGRVPGQGRRDAPELEVRDADWAKRAGWALISVDERIRLTGPANVVLVQAPYLDRRLPPEYSEISSQKGTRVMMADLVNAFATIAFVGVLVGCTLAGSTSFGLQQRAGLLERRDPSMAEALRRADAMSDLAPCGGFAGIETMSPVCTPSRRSWIDGARIRAADSDLRVEPLEESLPTMPATVVALAKGRHVIAKGGHVIATPRRRQSPTEPTDPAALQAEPAQRAL